MAEQDLRQLLQEALDELTAARGELRSVSKRRDALDAKIRAAEGEEAAAAAVAEAAEQKLESLVTTEWPEQLSQKGVKAAAEAAARLAACRPAAKEEPSREAPEAPVAEAPAAAEEALMASLRQLSNLQTKQLQMLSMRCASLEEQLRGAKEATEGSS
eukprot:TRINITY_DN40823_c0_g2_i1.p2 TRINITY_DN40823_c0_g2~~TRINITY_DN40823_c0_g2_i1.p2  ORF type:complete len:158 (+),score=69.28 TRINITY_DN40823_c0_g2_i1:171-644(+)